MHVYLCVLLTLAEKNVPVRVCLGALDRATEQLLQLTKCRLVLELSDTSFAVEMASSCWPLITESASD